MLLVGETCSPDTTGRVEIFLNEACHEAPLQDYTELQKCLVVVHVSRKRGIVA